MNRCYISGRHRRRALLVLFLALAVVWPLAASAATPVDGDFSLDFKVNGDDLSELETIVIDSDGELNIDLYISDVTREVVLNKVSVVLSFAGISVATLTRDLGSFPVAAGEDYRRSVAIDLSGALQPGNLTLITGIYRARVKLEYVVDDRPKTWGESRNVRIPGNPLSTPVGAAAAVVAAGTFVAALALVRSMITTRLPLGITVPGNVSLTPSSSLYNLALERLEPATRGRVTANIVKAARGRIVRERCPVCDTRLKHGHCYTCQKSAREVRREYVDRVRALALQGGQLLASGEVATLDALCSRLDISSRLGTDVLATLQKAKLIKVRGLARKLTTKALTTGIGSGLSAVLWITVGGLTALSSAALIAILMASVIIPISLTRILQRKARRTLKKRPGS